MKKSSFIASIAFLLVAVLLGKAFIGGEAIRWSLLIFWSLGMGLAFVRLFVNHFIKKMKGKKWSVKIAFIAVLLGFGLPFQAWFRKEVLYGMPAEFMAGSIAVLVLGLVFMTFFYGILKKKFTAPPAGHQSPPPLSAD